MYGICMSIKVISISYGRRVNDIYMADTGDKHAICLVYVSHVSEIFMAYKCKCSCHMVRE